MVQHVWAPNAHHDSKVYDLEHLFSLYKVYTYLRAVSAQPDVLWEGSAQVTQAVKHLSAGGAQEAFPVGEERG